MHVRRSANFTYDYKLRSDLSKKSLIWLENQKPVSSPVDIDILKKCQKKRNHTTYIFTSNNVPKGWETINNIVSGSMLSKTAYQLLTFQNEIIREGTADERIDTTVLTQFHDNSKKYLRAKLTNGGEVDVQVLHGTIKTMENL